MSNMRFTNEIKLYSAELTTEADGTLSHDTDSINGEILKILYVVGTIPATTDITITTDESITDTIDTRTNLAADVAVYPAAELDGAAAGDNKWCRHAVNGLLNIAIAQGGNAGTVTIYIYYK